ncbi:MAG TPA: lipoprotein insertase outer membrane protein LolB [Nevskiaceae bacterium]|nr:lipoprotein insertase outer membrane protein LolB [Nevskiaceae bacterium]
MRWRIALGAALLLAGCAGEIKPDLNQQQAQQAWQQRSQALAQLRQFNLAGRIASTSASGNLSWQQHADGSFELHLSGPLGAGAMSISGTERWVEVRTSKGTHASGDPQAWIYQQTGWQLPVTGLRWWVLGLPSPHSPAHVELDGGGRAASIDQDGWHLAYSEYQELDGRTLPRRFEAVNGEAKIKLVADRWTGLE